MGSGYDLNSRLGAWRCAEQGLSSMGVEAGVSVPVPGNESVPVSGGVGVQLLVTVCMRTHDMR